MSAKQGLAGALALAMTVWLANAAAAEGTTDAVPVSATPLSHHVPAVDDAVSPGPDGTPGSYGYLFVAGSSFSPRASSAPMTYASGGCIQSTSDYVVTDMQLPNGAAVLGIRSYYYNNGQSGSVDAALTSYDGAGAFTDHVVGASTLNAGYSDEYFAAGTPVVIDNFNRSYVLLGMTVADMRFCGIRVYFQYP